MRVSVLALLMVIVLGGSCSGSEDGDETTTPSVTATTTRTATPSTATSTPTPDETPLATPPPATASSRPPGGTEAAAAAARDALARWLGPVGDPSAIEVAGVESVTWPDGCLGLGGTGEACTDALVPGYRVMLRLANATYEVRVDETGELARWAPSLQVLARFEDAGPNVLEFRSDDGGMIVAQAVSGTDFRVDVTALDVGEPVGLGLVDAPQSGGLLLVSLDRVAGTE